MATIYIFNPKIINQAGTRGSVVNVTIAGYTVRATVGDDGYAHVNASPFYRAKFANVDVNTSNTFTTTKTLGGDTLKYGCIDPDETAEYSRLAYIPANQENTTPAACQVKLRWLDHYGNWKYYNFQRGTRSTTDASAGEMLPGLVGSVAKTEFLRPQIKTSVESLTVCAPNVDETTWMYLSEIKRSLHVCMLGDDDWIPVVVSAGTSSWVVDQKNKQKQDFEITLNLPEQKMSL